jgi:CubicO group peptidase (beta-lactamase class C family)
MTRDAHGLADPVLAGLSAPALARLTDVLKAEIARKRLPGVVAAIARKGRLAYFEVLGRQGPDSDAPMQADSIFRIFSMTKPIVSLAVMMLVEEGRLFLGEPIAKYLSEFAEMKVGVERGGRLELEPAAAPITIQDLLRHTSGLTYDFVATGRLKDIYTQALLHRRSQTNAEFCKALASLPLLHQPGTHWSYSHSTDVLGRLVEVVSETSLEEFLQARILGPLGMADTAFSVPAGKASRLAQPFAKDPDTGNDVKLYDPREVPKLQSGGGGLVSTAHDYLRFLQMLSAGGTFEGARLIGRKTLAYMTSNHLGGGVSVDSALNLLAPGHGFGLGFAVRLAEGVAPFPASVGTYNWGGIAGTVFWVDPVEHLHALLMIQAPGQRDFYRTLFRNLVYAALD